MQPVVHSAGAKVIGVIERIDAERLSDTATARADQLIESAADRARRFLERDIAVR